MAGRADGALTTSAAAGSRRRPVVKTNPRGLLAFLLPLPVAAAAGLGVGLAPHPALVVEAAIVSALVLVARLEWAALAVIGTAVFEDYLTLVSPWAEEWLYAVLVVAWLVRRAGGPLHAHGLRAAVVPASLLVGAVLVAFVAHPHGRPGLAVCASYAVLAVVMLVLADCLCGPLAPARAARVYVLSCVAASGCGLVTALVSDRHLVAGPVASSDTLAFFLLAAVPLVGTVRTRPTQPVWWVWASFALLLAAGVGTQSRPGLVALTVMVVVAVLTGQLALRYAGALLAVVMTAVALLVAVLPLPIGQALTDPQRYADTNISQRIDVRVAAFDMTTSSPVVGLGPGAFALFHHEHRRAGTEPDATEPDLDTAYSTALEASAELGLLGLVALYAAWLVPMAGARLRWTRDRSGLTAATFLAAAGLLTASLIESQQFTLPLWLLAAVLLALGRPAPPWTPVFGAPSDNRTSGQPRPRS